MNDNIPLSDLKCGVYGMTPPERLHTTCAGCTKYIFKSLLDTITNCTKGNALICGKWNYSITHYTLNVVEIVNVIIHKVQKGIV
jgi:hypothetical protein